MGKEVLYYTKKIQFKNLVGRIDACDKSVKFVKLYSV